MQDFHNQIDKKIFSDKVTVILSISIVLIAMLTIVIFPFSIFSNNQQNNSFQSLGNKGLYIEKENFLDENSWKSSKSFLTNNLSYVVKLDKEALRGLKTENNVIYYDHQNYINLEAYTVENGIKKELVVNSESFIYPYVILPEKTPDSLYIVVEGIIKNRGLKVAGFNDFSTMNNQLFSFLIFSLGIIFSMVLSSIILTLLLYEKYFTLHGAFLFSAFMHLITGTGLSRLILKTNPITYYFWTFLSFLLMIIFAFKYLDVKKNFKYLKYLYYGHIVALTGLLPFSFTTFNIIFFNLTLIFAISVTFLVLITIFLKFVKNISFPIYFFAGALILGVSIIVLVLNQLGVIGYSIFFEYSFAYAIALEGMFFTLGIFDHIQRLKLMNRHYFKIAVKDQLTGLYNRYYLDVNIDKYFNQGRRYHEPLSMLLIDVDHFKKVNDTYGHDVGDQVLIELSGLLKENIRESDLLIRWGGEEFLVVLPKTDSLGCSALGEKLRKTVASYAFQEIDGLTISIGGGKWLPFEKKDELFKKIDDALYEAKKSGRNKYVMNLSYYASMKTLEQELRWSKAYNSNHQVIDQQHQTIFNILKNLVASIKSDENFEKYLDEMFEYSNKHIKTEEAILEKKSYDKLSEHKKVHKELLDILKTSIKKYKKSTITKEQLIYELIQDVIVGHLINYDYKYFDLFD